MGQHPTAGKATALAALAALLAAGCSGTTDEVADVADAEAATSRAPAPDASAASQTAAPDGQEVTLTLGNALTDMPEQLIAWAAEVREQTGRTITFSVTPEFGEGSAWDDKEQAVLDAVASGELDLGWVGARALPSFQPMVAPMLVDSHDLQQAVLEAGVAQRMLDDIGIEGVTGLGVLPGPLRRMLGVSQDFRTPEDFEGAVVMGDRNSTTLETMAALGVAETVPGVESVDLDGIDGLVAHVGAVVGNSYQDHTQSFTGNLNLWPRPLVLVGNTETLEALSEEHRRALLGAAEATLAEQLDIARDEDRLRTEWRQEVCSSALEVVELSEDELAVLRTAVAPVHEQLRQEQDHAERLDEIEALKSELDAPPDGFSCEDAPAT